MCALPVGQAGELVGREVQCRPTAWNHQPTKETAFSGAKGTVVVEQEREEQERREREKSARERERENSRREGESGERREGGRQDVWHMKYKRRVQQCLFSFSQLLTQASPVELEPVLSMYLTLLEETKSSLTFKVLGKFTCCSDVWSSTLCCCCGSH